MTPIFLLVPVFKINRQLLKVSSFVLQVPDCYLRGWRRSGANFIKSKINICPLSFHPLLPPALYTYLHFWTWCVNLGQWGPASCGNVPLGGLDPPMILYHWLVLPALAECLLSLWGCISNMLAAEMVCHRNSKCYEEIFLWAAPVFWTATAALLLSGLSCSSPLQPCSCILYLCLCSVAGSAFL